MASSGLSRRPANAPTTTHDDDETAPSSPPVSATPAEKSPEAQLESLGPGSDRRRAAPSPMDRASPMTRAIFFSPRRRAPLWGQRAKAHAHGGGAAARSQGQAGVPQLLERQHQLCAEGGILMELVQRIRIGIVRNPMSRRTPLTERPVTVLSTLQTGETLLDEMLKMMKQTEDSGERMGVATWVDLLSARPRPRAYLARMTTPAALLGRWRAHTCAGRRLWTGWRL
ncbi:hypothetical protein C8J57DRAFT_1565280 [Mycena rebaudengoi]|nr:hypothetical protein C8J57DRAFT_1565280 [Mycena rebaudengoi]